jgi:hypothetical protein
MRILERHVSPDGNLVLIVQEDETGDIAVGFEGYAWHTHADILAALTGQPQREALRAFVDDIVTDRAIVAVAAVGATVRAAWVTDNPESAFKYKPDDESIRFRRWSGVEYVPRESQLRERTR